MKADEETDLFAKSQDQKRGWFIALMAIAIVTVLCGILWFSITSRFGKENRNLKEGSSTLPDDEVRRGELNIRTTRVDETRPNAKIIVTGVVEANQQQMQQVSALAVGRVDEVTVGLGEHVKPGMVLIRIKSPQVAEMHGTLHETETKLSLARANLERAKQAANKVSVLKAKATLDEAESTLKRTTLLVSEGLTARKDLIAAQSEYERAKAEYNFQKNISLNREVAEAIAAVRTNETEAQHIRDSLSVLDAQLPKTEEGSEHDISSLELRAPIAGIVIERLVNPGAGVEVGKPLLTIANTSSLWVIANVPEKDMPDIRLGVPAQVLLLGGKQIAGTVNYIDPRLNEDTRTSRVRIAINNSDNRIRVGSFAQVEFTKESSSAGSLFVPTAAVQIIDGKTVVFVKAGEGLFKVRRIVAGDETDGLVPVFKGLNKGDEIASDGSFVLKSKLLKTQLEGAD